MPTLQENDAGVAKAIKGGLRLSESGVARAQVHLGDYVVPSKHFPGKFEEPARCREVLEALS